MTITLVGVAIIAAALIYIFSRRHR